MPRPTKKATTTKANQVLEIPQPTFEFLPCPGSEEYDRLLSILASCETETGHLIQILNYLEDNISRLEVEYKDLVMIILQLNWLDKGDELRTKFQAFVLTLVSAHMAYLRPCLRMLIKKFYPDIGKDITTIDPEMNRKMTENVSHVHSLLKSLSEIVPMCIELLPAILEELFPYINKSVHVFEHYTQGLLTLSSYLPSLRLGVLELLANNMLKLDVRSPRIDINTALCAAEDESDSRDETMFDMDEDENVESKKDIPGIEAERPLEVDMVSQLKERLPHAGSLDIMMSLNFKFINDTCFLKGELDWEAAKKLYRELLWVFDKYIFPTHESCHVQFLLFYICNLKEALSDGFIDYLWKKVTDPTAQCIYRQTAACYIGSFVTRASFLPLSTAKHVLELMAQWIHTYLDQTSELQIRPDIEHHGPFYAVCQSAFYIFCFLHNDLLQSRKGHKWGESLNFQRVITSKLNPLRVCMPIVVKTFASAARMHQLAFCDTIIERNNRYSLPVTSSKFDFKGNQKTNLESYFPFDPYLLPGSSSYITPLYREFHGALPDVDNNNDEDEDDFLPEEDERIDTPVDMGMMMGKSPVDFLHYSISPGFKHM